MRNVAPDAVLFRDNALSGDLRRDVNLGVSSGSPHSSDLLSVVGHQLLEVHHYQPLGLT